MYGPRSVKDMYSVYNDIYNFNKDMHYEMKFSMYCQMQNAIPTEFSQTASRKMNR